MPGFLNLLLLLGLGLGLAAAAQDALASKVSGPWRTVQIAASSPHTILEGGVMRTYFRSVECDADCGTIFIEFYVLKDGVCQKFKVTGTKDENGVYSTEYEGENYYHVVFLSKNIIIFYNVHVEEKETTHLVLLASKNTSLTQEEQEKYLELVRKNGISKENIEYVADTDICPK